MDAVPDVTSPALVSSTQVGTVEQDHFRRCVRISGGYRFESGPIVKIVVGLFAAAVVALGLVALFTGNGIAIALLITIVVTGAVGFVLERVDASRRREQGSQGTHDEHWGYHGRPGR